MTGQVGRPACISKLFILKKSSNCRCGTGTCGCDWMKYAKAANVSYQTFLELIISVPQASIWIHTFKMSTLKSTLSIQNAMSSLGILTSKKFYFHFNYFSMSYYLSIFSLSRIYLKWDRQKRYLSHTHGSFKFFKLILWILIIMMLDFTNSEFLVQFQS